jgi:uncharacterized protein (DUF1778 family)
MSMRRRRARPIATRVNNEEFNLLKRAASGAGLSIAGFLRARCLAEAKRELNALRHDDALAKASRASTLAQEALASAD